MSPEEIEQQLKEMMGIVRHAAETLDKLHAKAGGKYSARRSPEIKDLAEALAKAQAKIQHAVADSRNPFFGSQYADLASVFDACREPLSANGLSVVQTLDTDDIQLVRVTTLLLHSTGQFIETTIACRLPEHSTDGKTTQAQKMGGLITYLRRYSLAAIVGVAPIGEDTDGNEGAKGEKEDTSLITAAQVTNLVNLANANKKSIPEFLAYWKIEKMEDLPAKHYQLSVNILKKQAGKGTASAPKE